ncbi:MAG: hypothetical protein DHS20C09_17760 [marine bacterium B5-7]|nr:MAG: hypothetical protein DHS20C09_17760 [marine bacterium B5-7]
MYLFTNPPLGSAPQSSGAATTRLRVDGTGDTVHMAQSGPTPLLSHPAGGMQRERAAGSLAKM